MNIAIIGYGKEGQSAYDYWQSDTNQLTICDQNPDILLPDNVQRQLGSEYLHGLDQFDLIIRSPGIHPGDIIQANSASILSKVSTGTNEFFKVCPSKNIIGVTGSKGKGTTSTLVAKILETAGKKVLLGANIGIPPLDLLKTPINSNDWIVLELANFQLIDLNYSPHIAICLMVVPEHLNWHTDMNEYIASKQQLFAHQQPDDLAIYYADNDFSKQVASSGRGQKIPYFAAPGALIKDDFIHIDGQNICRTSEIKLPGQHNRQNVCAAVTAAWQVTKEVDAYFRVLTTFTGLSHRLELIRELDGVKYYDDSFGTTPETAQVALEAFQEPKIIILGGSDKGASYDELARTVASSNTHLVVLIGLTGPAIKIALEKNGYSNIVDGGNTMPQIVETAKSLASPGDIILLSTACASFDMFKNYEDRGEQFTQAVKALA